MIYIFHGDDQKESRLALSQMLEQNSGSDILKLDNKEIDLDKINNFLQGNSLFAISKVLVLMNFFSISKPILDKLTKIIQRSEVNEIFIWQDKNLTVAQLKIFPKAKVFSFKLNNQIFACLNAVKPKNLKNFMDLFEQIIEADLYDLFLYLLKRNIRKQLVTFSKFNSQILKNVYLQLIELDYQTKTGQLAIPKELALQRIITNLLR